MYFAVNGTGFDPPVGSLHSSATLVYDRSRVLINVPEGTQRFVSENRLKLSKYEAIIVTRPDATALGGLAGLLLTLEAIDPPIKRPPHQHTKLKSCYGFSNTWANCVSNYNGWKGMYRKLIKCGFNNQNPMKDEAAPTPPPEFDQMDPWKLYIELRDLYRQVDVFGPPGIFSLIRRLCEKYARLRFLDFRVHELDVESFTELALEPSTEATQCLASVTLPASGATLKFLCVQTPKTTLMEAKRRKRSYWWLAVVEGHAPKQLGKFLIDEAIKLKIPKGPLYAKLKNGESVDLPDGRTIEPSMVCEASKLGDTWVYLDHRNDDETQTAHLHVTSYFSKRRECDLAHVFSATPNSALSGDVARLLEPSKRYFCANAVDSQFPATCYPGFTSFHMALNVLSQVFFPVQRMSTSTASFSLGENENAIEPHYHVHLACDGKRADIPSKIQGTLMAKTSQYEAALKSPGAAEVIKQMSEIQKKLEELTKTNEYFPGCRVVCYGTGSAIPSRFRNVSCTVLEVTDNSHHIMLDCGEGTAHQLLYACGGAIDLFRKKLEAIDIVIISHGHADHHLGLWSMIHYWRLFGIKEPILLVPSAMVESLRQLYEYDNIEAIDIDKPYEHTEEEYKRKISFCEVFHGISGFLQCYGCRIDINKTSINDINVVNDSSFSVSYSGDTRPCDAFAELSQNVDLMIHEATFEDALQDEAISRYHSTISEAQEIAVKANVKGVLLNHISQRYPMAPQSHELECSTKPVYVLAFDMLHLPLWHLVAPEARELVTQFGNVIGKFLPLLRSLFLAEEDEFKDE